MPFGIYQVNFQTKENPTDSRNSVLNKKKAESRYTNAISAIIRLMKFIRSANFRKKIIFYMPIGENVYYFMINK